MRSINLRNRPVSSTRAKHAFIKLRANRIAAVANNPARSAELVKELADEMLDIGLYLKSTAKTDRCITVKRLIEEMGFWDSRVAVKVAQLIWPKYHQ